MARKTRTPISTQEIWTRPACLLAFGFGIGLVPVAPGTFGTLLGVLIYWALAGTSPAVYSVVVLGMALAGVGICASATRSLQIGDHPGVVWDEIVGFLIAMWAVPVSWLNVAVGFLLFRIFDVAKPWPIAWADRRIGGGLGIMLDDVLAGAFTWLLLQLLLPWLPL